MNTWSPLWSFCVESSLWDETDSVVKIFLTMMAIKDADHICRFSAYQIARKARKSEAEVLKALEVLSEPDKKRIEPQEHEGRRIKLVEEGWLILNGEKYQTMVREEMRRARLRRAQAAHRERVKVAAMSEAERAAYLSWRRGERGEDEPLRAGKRKKKERVSGEYSEREKRFVEADGNGDTALADKIAAEGVPMPQAAIADGMAEERGKTLCEIFATEEKAENGNGEAGQEQSGNSG